MKKLKKVNGGFTLIEILIVIGIIAVLAAIVLIAVNPARQFAQANNAQRSSNVNAIINAIGQYAVDNKGDLSALGIPGTADDIGKADVDICAQLVPTYLPALPVDPMTEQTDTDLDENDQGISSDDCDETYLTGYQIETEDTRIIVSAPATEDVEEGTGVTPDISVTR